MASVGANHVNLPLQLLEARAFADDVAQGLGFADFFTEVSGFQLQPGAEPIVFFEGARVHEGHGDVIGKNAQPGRALLGDGNAREQSKHAQHLVFVSDGLRVEAVNLFRCRPFPPGRHRRVTRNVLHHQGLAGGRHAADFPHTERNALELVVEPRPILFGARLRSSCAGYQVEAGSLVRTLRPHAAG